MVIVSFVLGFGVVRAINAQEVVSETTDESAATVTSIMDNGDESLERIPSPEYIKFFQIIKREGNALFGIRKPTATPAIMAEERNRETRSEEVENSNKLEKIAHPSLLNLFERIQRIGTALWGIRKNATSTPAAPFVISPEAATCIATAIDTKDKVLMLRVSTAATELNSALSARSICQQNGVKASTTPRDVLNGCVKVFVEAQKTIKDTSRQVQKEAWATYQDSLKACRPATSTSAVPMIEDGGSLFD